MWRVWKNFICQRRGTRRACSEPPWADTMMAVEDVADSLDLPKGLARGVLLGCTLSGLALPYTPNR